jgi:hypothetical protein
MAEILRALAPSEVQAYAPMREFHYATQAEVYKTVGNYLADLYELDEGLVEDGCFLVELQNRQQVAFAYGVLAGDGEESDADSDYEYCPPAVLSGFFMAMVEHWRDYDRQAAADQPIDESRWDEQLPRTLVDMGMEPDFARSLCEVAKLEARFF